MRFEARTSNALWQFDTSPSDLKEIEQPVWIDPDRKGFARSEPNLRVRISAPASPPADGAEVVPPCEQRGPRRRPRPRERHARCCAGEGAGAAQRAWRLSLPGRRFGALVAKGVMTGGKSGLRASGGKEIAKEGGGN